MSTWYLLFFDRFVEASGSKVYSIVLVKLVQGSYNPQRGGRGERREGPGGGRPTAGVGGRPDVVVVCELQPDLATEAKEKKIEG